MAVRSLPDQTQSLLDEWRQQINDLMKQIGQWAKTRGWKVKVSECSIEEDGVPAYKVEALEILLSQETRVRVEPIARFTLNRRGVVEVYGWPTLRRVRLQPAGTSGKSWDVITDSGIPLRQDWSEENFATLVGDLVA
ncbi:MAG: hypothetical protein LC772_06345 [Chloroflexi bacterium]|nr:hypothetical protein [Chloroflexota bacterium]